MWQSFSHSLVFNTIVLKLIISLRYLGLNSLCHSIPNFMMGTPQIVWIGATLGLYIGAPHDCMLSLLLIVDYEKLPWDESAACGSDGLARS